VSAKGASALWCELAWLGGERAEEGVLIELDGERVGAVATGVASPPPQATSLAGLTIPGLANAHSHAFQRALRGRTQAGQGDFWTWRRRMYEIAEAIEPDVYFTLARATFAEMVLAGITAVGEFHYLHHGADGARYEDPNVIGRAVIEAAREAGIRITLLDTCYLHGGIGREADGVQLRFSDGSADAWAERVDGLEARAGARVGAAIHSVRAVDPEAPRARLRAAGRERGLRFRLRQDPDRAARGGRRSVGALHRSPRHASDRGGLRAARRRGMWSLPLPDHRT
jgi:formiminoglutamate deiminase